MPRLSTTIAKEFFLGPTWDMESAERVDHMLAEIAENTPAIRKGRYFGNGIVQNILVGDLPQTPIFAMLQPVLGGVPFFTLIPYATGPITAWTKDGFTLAASGAYNTPLIGYYYLVIA